MECEGVEAFRRIGDYWFFPAIRRNTHQVVWQAEIPLGSVAREAWHGRVTWREGVKYRETFDEGGM